MILVCTWLSFPIYYSKDLNVFTKCSLGRNHLTGTIPTEVRNANHLSELKPICCIGTLFLTSPFVFVVNIALPCQLGMIQKLSSLSLQWNDLTGTIPQRHLKNLLTLRALQLEGNEKISGEIERHSLLCQMRNKCELYCCFARTLFKSTLLRLNIVFLLSIRSWPNTSGSGEVHRTPSVEDVHCYMCSFFRKCRSFWQAGMCMLHRVFW